MFRAGPAWRCTGTTIRGTSKRGSSHGFWLLESGWYSSKLWFWAWAIVGGGSGLGISSLSPLLSHGWVCESVANTGFNLVSVCEFLMCNFIL